MQNSECKEKKKNETVTLSLCLVYQRSFESKKSIDYSQDKKLVTPALYFHNQTIL